MFCRHESSAIEKIFLTTTQWFHSLVLTLILHKSHTELHCGGSVLSVDTPNPTLASLPPLTRCFYVLPL